MALWSELFDAFERAYRQEPPDESLIGRIYAFAEWCAQASRGPDAARDPPTAVAVAFYEEIPTCRRARDDMPRWLRYSDVAGSRAVFAYLIGEDAYEELVDYMARNRDRYEGPKLDDYPQ